MMKDFDALLDAFGDGNKLVEMTTNGQILTDRNIGRLLGRRIELYVSLDAATAATYAKLRNDTFDRILANLRRPHRGQGRSGRPAAHPPRLHADAGQHARAGRVRGPVRRPRRRPVRAAAAERDRRRARLDPRRPPLRLQPGAARLRHPGAAERPRRRPVPPPPRALLEPARLRRRDGADLPAGVRRGAGRGERAAGRRLADRAERPDPERRSRANRRRRRPVWSPRTASNGPRAGPSLRRPARSARTRRVGPAASPSRPDPSRATPRRPSRTATTRSARHAAACLEPWKSLYVLPPRRHALLLRRPPPRRHGGVPRDLERPDPPGHPPPHRPRRVPRVLPGLAVLPHRAEEPPCPDAGGAASGPRLHETTLLGLARQARALGFKPALKAFDQALLGGAGMALYRRLRRIPHGRRPPAAR